MEAYLDNSATTRPCDQAVDAMVKSMREGYYNPSALYYEAVQVEKALKKARDIISKPVHLGESNVIFTSGGTESDNLAIMGHMMGQRREGVILYSAAEHPAVKNACIEAAALYGQIAREIPLDSRGSLDMQAMEGLMDSRVRLICVMQVSNETGAIMPIKRVVAMRDRLAPEAAIHVDGVQGYLRTPFSLLELNVQSYAVSSHKVNGPKGVGALIVKDGHRVRPLMVGGGQQGNRRSGTENTVGIAGFAAAVESFPHIVAAQARLKDLKSIMVRELTAAIPDMQILGPQPEDADSAPHVLCISLPPVRAETMVHALEEEGVMVGTGSACSSHSKKRSATLTSMGVKPELMDSAIRISFSVQNTRDEVAYAVENIIRKYNMLARFKRR